MSDRVSLLGLDDRVLDGWALNVSRGGLRAILEEKVELGEQFDITLGASDEGLTRKGRVVWVQEEPDGVIVGLEFMSLSGMHKSVPPAPMPEDGSEADVAAPEAATAGATPDAAPTTPDAAPTTPDAPPTDPDASPSKGDLPSS